MRDEVLRGPLETAVVDDRNTQVERLDSAGGRLRMRRMRRMRRMKTK